MSNRTVKAKSGRQLTQEDLERLSEEAEAGYDLAKARRRRVGRLQPSATQGRLRE